MFKFKLLVYITKRMMQHISIFDWINKLYSMYLRALSLVFWVHMEEERLVVDWLNTPPSAPCVKVNFDAAFKSNEQISGTRAVIRDNEGW